MISESIQDKIDLAKKIRDDLIQEGHKDGAYYWDKRIKELEKKLNEK